MQNIYEVRDMNMIFKYTTSVHIGVANYGALRHVPLRLTTIYFFQCTLTYTKSDSDYISTFA